MPDRAVDSLLYDKSLDSQGETQRTARASDIVSQDENTVKLSDERVFSRGEGNNWTVSIPGQAPAEVKDLKVENGELSYRVGNLQAVEGAGGKKTVINLGTGRTTVFGAGGEQISDSQLPGGPGENGQGRREFGERGAARGFAGQGGPEMEQLILF